MPRVRVLSIWQHHALIFIPARDGFSVRTHAYDRPYAITCPFKRHGGVLCAFYGVRNPTALGGGIKTRSTGRYFFTGGFSITAALAASPLFLAKKLITRYTPQNLDLGSLGAGICVAAIAAAAITSAA